MAQWIFRATASALAWIAWALIGMAIGLKVAGGWMQDRADGVQRRGSLLEERRGVRRL